jgi:hypothetical protein
LENRGIYINYVDQGDYLPENVNFSEFFSVTEYPNGITRYVTQERKHYFRVSGVRGFARTEEQAQKWLVLRDFPPGTQLPLFDIL